MRRLARWFVRILIVLVVLAGLGFGVYRWLMPPAAAGALREETFQAEVQPMEDVLLVSGQVKPAVTIELRAEASGIVEFVSVKEGRSGERRPGAGPAGFEARPVVAGSGGGEPSTGRAAGRGNTGWISTRTRSSSGGATTSDLRRLYEQGLLPKDQLEQRELEFKSAARTVERAKRSIESSQARITQAKASVDQARTQLTKTTIRAPFDAFVLRRQVEVGSGVAGVGNSASGGSILMTLGDARESSLFAKATAVDARRLKIGQAARVRLDSDASQQLPATVVSVSTAGDVDPSTKLTTFPLVIALKAQPPGGWVNVPAQAEIVMSATIDSVVIPEKCVRTDPAGRSYVTVQSQSGNRHAGRSKSASIQKDQIQIRSGLEKGETVVLPVRAEPASASWRRLIRHRQKHPRARPSASLQAPAAAGRVVVVRHRHGHRGGRAARRPSSRACIATRSSSSAPSAATSSASRRARSDRRAIRAGFTVTLRSTDLDAVMAVGRPLRARRWPTNSGFGVMRTPQAVERGGFRFSGITPQRFRSAERPTRARPVVSRAASTRWVRALWSSAATSPTICSSGESPVGQTIFIERVAVPGRGRSRLGR